VSAWVGACLLAFPAAAAPPNGKSTITVSGPAQIFVPAGIITFGAVAQTPVGVVTLEGAANLHADIAGAFPSVVVNVGSANFGAVDVGGITNAQVPALVTGKISGHPDAPKLHLTTVFGGAISVLGSPGSGKGSIKLSCARDSDPTSLTCSGRIHFCGGAAGVGHACAGGPVQTTVPTPGGDWTLSLDLATDESNKVTGSAMVLLGDGVTSANFEVRGKYNPKTDTSNLEFADITDVPAKAKVSLSRFAADGSAGILKFKLVGQSGTVDLSMAP
jgi:hypothetical protein